MIDDTNSILQSRLKARAREIRKDQTPAESLLWEELRNRKCNGYKFRRQHVIRRFIVDFYCASAKLVIELDGPVHRSTKEEDFIRETELNRMGLRIVRFDNDEVVTATRHVIGRISTELAQCEANETGE